MALKWRRSEQDEVADKLGNEEGSQQLSRLGWGWQPRQVERFGPTELPGAHSSDPPPCARSRCPRAEAPGMTAPPRPPPPHTAAQQPSPGVVPASRAGLGSLRGRQACRSARTKPLPKQRAPTTPSRQLIRNTGPLQRPLLNWDLGQLLTSWVSLTPSTPGSHRIMRIARVSVSHLPGAGKPQQASICWHVIILQP